MTIPSASLTEVSLQLESSLAGSGTGNVATLRLTSEGLMPAVSTIASEEIDSTRNVSDLNKVSAQAEGDIEFEMSADSYDALLTTVFQSADGNAGIVEDMGDNVDHFNASTQQSFKIEKKTSDGSNNLFQLYEGMVPGALEITAESGSFVTGTLSFLGSKINTMDASANLTSTVSYETQPFTTVDANTTVLFDASADSVTYSDYGALPGSAKVTAFSMSFDNGLRAQTQIGSTDLAGIGSGRFTTTGTLTVYATDATLFNNYVNTTKFGLMFQVGNSSDNYRFYLPEVVITSAEVLAGGNDDDVLMELEWQAVKTTVGADTFTCKLIKNEA